ncbi:HXXEE domain-containing protein [Paenibacillus sp. MMS20-IR301]|uniref:HXXEE domain-containing protein n=1 Tax=Paenibacillus sp. MMS20-IR301 TaxID=2895946 RepID=UPI0028E70A3C|nr:HXXEE domain-containing protein [Paenibacillus sp. MMS20-IR301]WNS45637.1 HXXEE domain-containing protein [Paenibacillus sp. MMS20-IR301]
MLNWLNVHIDKISLLWLLPILFMFHDFEEIITVETWKRKYGAAVEKELSPSLRNRFAPLLNTTTRNFAIDVLFVYIFIVGVTFAAVFAEYYLLYLAVLAVFLLHVFTHLAQSVYLKRYTPGVVTAVLIALPYSMYAFYRLLNDHIVSKADIGWALLLMLLVTPLVVWGLMKKRARE